VPNPVVVRKLKFDGSVRYTWQGDLVDARGDDWLIVFHDSAHHAKDPPTPDVPPGFGIHTIGLRQPLTVLHWFDELGRFVDAKCDAALPARLAGRTIDFVDLDLDLVVLPDGHHYLRDRDVFEARGREMGYPDAVRRTAWWAILQALRMVRRRRFPFDGSPEALLGRELAARGPL
jgi:protein associated with RNAse G/E